MNRSTGTATRIVAWLATLAIALAVPVVAAPAAEALSPSALILKLTNEYRASKGLAALRWNAGAATVAQNWSARMLAERRMYHNPDVWSQIPSGWTSAAENVGYACGYSSATAAAQAIMTAWKNSPGHNQNLLGASSDLGVGLAWDSASKCAYTTQDFARYSGTPSTYSIFGTVTTSTGAAAAGAKVTASSSSGTWTTTADSSGSYQFVGLPRGSFVVNFTPANADQRAEFYTDAPARECARRIDLNSKDVVGLDARLSSATAPSISGDVLMCDVSADPASRFHTVFASEIQWLADEGVTTGWTNGFGGRNFQPGWTITREQMAAFLYRMAAASPSGTDASTAFVDVAASPFKTEIAWLASTGISKGWLNSNGTASFRPGESVRRDVMAAFLYRFAQEYGIAEVADYVAPKTSPFLDLPTSHVFYKEICWLESTGITRGWTVTAGREYRPNSAITREQMAAFLQRFDSWAA